MTEITCKPIVEMYDSNTLGGMLISTLHAMITHNTVCLFIMMCEIVNVSRTHIIAHLRLLGTDFKEHATAIH